MNYFIKNLVVNLVVLLLVSYSYVTHSMQQSKEVVSLLDTHLQMVLASPLGFFIENSSVKGTIALDYDSNAFITCTDDGIAQIWEASTGNFISCITGYTGIIRRVKFSHDKKNIISVSDDNSLCLFESSTGKLIKSLTKHLWGMNKVAPGVLKSIAFIPERRTFITLYNKGIGYLWDATTGKLICKLTEMYWETYLRSIESL